MTSETPLIEQQPPEREGQRTRTPKPADFAPESVFSAGHRWAGQARCTAWNCNQGRQCEARPVNGTSKCKVHGGRSLRGMASRSFKTGRYSKYMPDNLLDRYKHGLKDPDLIVLRDEISLLDSRIMELVAKAPTGESGATWKALRKSKFELMVANQASDQDAARRKLAEILTLIDTGVSEMQLWEEVQSLVETRRRLAESERKRLVDLSQMVSAADAMALVSGIAEVVKQYVQDRETLRLIQRDIGALANAGAGRALTSGSD